MVDSHDRSNFATSDDISGDSGSHLPLDFPADRVEPTVSFSFTDSVDVSESIMPSGATVRIRGLSKAVELNDKFACIVGFDTQSERYMIQSAAQPTRVKVLRRNMQYPAVCPECEAEVTSSCCFACGYGHSANSYKANTGASSANISDSSTSLAAAGGATLEQSNFLSELRLNDSDSNPEFDQAL